MMTRRFETRARWVASFSVALFGGALLGALACQGAPVPEVHGEPSVARAEASGAVLAPAASAATSAPAKPVNEPPAQVGLARYEEPGAAAGSVAAAASSPAGRAAPAADAPKTGGGETVQGTVVTEESFSVWLQAVSPVAAGGSATVEAVLVAKPPYHCNAEYPHKFKLGAAPPGLSYPEATVKGMQVTAERSVLRIPVQAQSPGKATVSGTLSFSVCTDERCLVEKRELALNLEVK